MKIHIDRITDEGLHIVETRPPDWVGWGHVIRHMANPHFPELERGGAESIEGPVHMDLIIQRFGNQVHVQGEIAAIVKALCARCLSSVSNQVVAPVDVFIVPKRAAKGGSMDPEEDEGFETYEGETIDLAEHLRGQLALHFPIRFLCKPECRGLCPHCGVNLNIESCSCSENKSDPRWAELKKLKF